MREALRHARGDLHAAARETSLLRARGELDVRDQASALFEIWLVGRRPTNDLRSAIFSRDGRCRFQAASEELGVAFEPLEQQIRGAAESESTAVTRAGAPTSSG